MLSSSDHIVAISSDFLPILDSWGVPECKVTVIENWAPMDEIDLVDRPTPWAVRHGLANKTVFLYSGTLGLKHNPGILWDLANSVRDRDDVRIVVISEGCGSGLAEGPGWRGSQRVDPVASVSAIRAAAAGAGQRRRAAGDLGARGRRVLRTVEGAHLPLCRKTDPRGDPGREPRSENHRTCRERRRRGSHG